VEKGVVVEKDIWRILVEAERGGCRDICSAGDSCSISAAHAKRRIWMENNLDARIGDEVRFFIAERTLILSSVVIYLIPAVMLIAGIAFGATCPGWLGLDCGVSSIAMGFICLIMSCGIIKIISGAAKKRSMFMPRLIEVSGRKK
jgi:positive regulator of sigma E activity